MHPDNETMAFYRLATRYLTGEASSADREQLVQQLKKPEACALFEEMRQGWDGSPADIEKGFDIDAISRRVAAAIAQERPEEQESLTPDDSCLASVTHRGKWFSRPTIGALAASLAILAVATGVWLRPSAPRPIASQPVNWVQRTCGVSERLLVTLGDGTKITLNSGSTLSYPETFGPRGRVVRLIGEAFFDVTHDEAHPFVIETSTLRVKVLGTQFNVRAFADGTKAEVSVVKGKVQVSELARQDQGTAQPVSLTPGQQYDFSPDTRAVKVQSVPEEAATGWMQDVFIWKREPALSAMRQLERRFGIVIEFSDPKLGAEELNCRFQGESLEEIFETLHLTEVFSYRTVSNNGKIERVILSPGKLAGFAAKR